MTEDPVPGERLAAALRVLSAAGVDLDVQQALDVLWLAGRLSPENAPLRRYATPTSPDAPDRADGPPEPVRAKPPESSRAAPAAAPAERELFGAARPLPTPDLLPPRRDTVPAGRIDEQRRARPVGVPESGAFLDELAMGRALRPLRRRHPSRHRMEVDEAGTAAALAETLLPDVVLRPARERWLSLVLVVDDGISMLLWHKVAAELKTLMLRLGAFASVRVLGLDSRSATAPRLHTKPFARRSPTVSPASLLDLSGRTLVLAVSDGMGAAWRSGALHRTLATWARRGPVALLHTLPPPLWESSGIRAERWQATTRRTGGANTSWVVTDQILPRDLVTFDEVPVPVLEPTAESLADWAALIASPGTTVELPLLSPPGSGAHPVPARDRESVQYFRDSATPEAYRLAAHLAAVAPVSVPVMHLVQQAVPWQARTSHLAEVFLGGLVRPHPAPVPDPLPKHRVFEFTDEARQALLDSVPHAELLRTGRRIGRQLEQLAGRSADFPAWLAQPDGSAVIPSAHRAFSTVEQRLLRRFGVGVRRSADGGGGAPLAPATDLTDDWSALTGDDPARLGPYELLSRRRGRRTIAYLARDDDGGHLVVRTPRPDSPPDADRLLYVEAEALRRLAGRHAPRLIGTGQDEGRPWLAMELLSDGDAPNAQPPRLSEVFTRSLDDGHPAFDVLQGLAVSHGLASALSICHLNGLVPERLTAESVLVRRRSVVLCDLSDCVIDGDHHGPGRPPRPADNIRALGELLQLIGSRPLRGRTGLSSEMELWRGGTWDPLRRVIESCLDENLEARPSAGDVADLLARYLTLGDSDSAVHADLPPVRVPLEEPEPASVPRSGTDDRPRGPRLRNFWRGFGGPRDERLVDALRIPLGHGPRITLVGAQAYSGRSTATVTLGSLIAAVRGRPVLALDGAPERGGLARYLPGGRNPATFRDVASLPQGASYDAVSALTTRLSTGLEVVAHRVGHFTASTTHTQEYTRLVGAAAPHYSAVLTDWGSQRLGDRADPVLDVTDSLVVCAMFGQAAVMPGAGPLAQLRSRGYAALADEALVLVAGFGASYSDLDLAVFAQQLGVPARQLIPVPFDPSFIDPGFPGLGRLRPRTVRAFAEAAARLLAPAGA
ncbi:SAV_2336 N-terminal domain-related protein [Streptomyces sp. VRA16 Mangrove soil]|uniref:SAV_2336 N-terminal domain-related protein n=1 Tax=Streptomyces sp. VRA16 Mangrove soil TaxID=2817434 RepID=UPI001A9D1DC6|nr:SAV_2336 N-terminal domain-related protein [Streptomyces sp. VRA16 Mangrove soil]MBO1330898.1 hypothetical protein [Streptomyces sp. VRA16 Mangrove soil]